MKKLFLKRINSALGIILVIGAFLVAVWVMSLNYESLRTITFNIFTKIIKPPEEFPTSTAAVSEIKNIKKFASLEEFKTYLEESKLETEISIGGGFSREGIIPAPLSPMMEGKGMGGGGIAPDRVSQTTVQVSGVDEPDIVKTDGKEIYFSGQQRIYYDLIDPGFRERLTPDSKIMPPYPYYQEVGTKIIKAFPPANLVVDSEIKGKSGDLLLSKNILVVFSSQTNEIYGYDVSEPKSPKEKWKIKLENNSSIVGARLYKDKVYLVTQQSINEISPCPIRPLTIGEAPLVIDCKEIYHPVVSVPTDVTFTAMTLDPVSGKIEKNISFVGYSGGSVVYMSEKSVYITYNYIGDIIKFYANFFKDNQDLVSSSIVKKIESLVDYDISQQSKLYEFQFLLGKYLNSLNSDERLKIENEFGNRLADYYKAHKRDLEKTGIVKIKVGGFEISATGEVPGYPLNQFALDEYQDNLRVAVTVGERLGWGFGFGMGRGESANDVYVLDNDLKIIGKVLDLGLTERIYSVRFIEDKGYVVTFRQTDPFYVLDLENPKNPKLAGELKIPGYSSYLHPLDATHILGIGQDGSQVKISLFDVSDAKKPKELDKYLLDEYWTEVANNYHAFLLDKKHNIFFLPGGKGGYVFSYLLTTVNYPICTPEGNCPPRFERQDYILTLQKAVSQNSVKRAIYINDYLYIIGDDKITVLNELNWEKVKELDLVSPIE